MFGPAKLIHEIIPVGMLQCNCHIIADPDTREALIVDPGADAERILDVINRHKLHVSSIVITHAHIDHVGGLGRLQAVTGAPVQIHQADLELYRMLDVQAAMLGMQAPEKIKVEDFLKEGDTVRWGPCSATVIHTPGHTQGSICLYMPPGSPDGLTSVPREAVVSPSAVEPTTARGREGLPDIATPRAGLPAVAEALTGKPVVASAEAARLFAGDTLFAGSIGRTDLWGGSFDTIMKSLKGKLLALPDATIVYPGHGKSTTIGSERERNPFLVGN